jgi:RNA polymerase sigma-70 factor, ECF subfamily
VIRRSDDFGGFYEANYGRTVALVAALVGSRHEAEDVAQEAFARALTQWPLLRRYDLPEAWVRKVALRIAVDSGRRMRRNLATAARIAVLRQPAAPEPVDSLTFTALGAALRELPLREREAIVLHYVADLSVEAIARESGLPVGTVKTRLAAGRRHLERYLSEELPGVAETEGASR